METEIMIRYYTDTGAVQDTTLSWETYKEFGKDARRYLAAILAPLPKNKYHGLEVFEVDQDGVIIRKLGEWGDIQSK